MSKRPLILLGVLAVLAAGAGGWFYLHRDHAAGADTLTLYGDVDIREVQPAFNDSGPIATITVQEGAQVKCGDLVATLDDARYVAALAQAKAQMENQRQALAKLLAGSRPEEIAQAKATMDALQVTYLNNEATYERYDALAATSAGTIQQRDDAKAAFGSVRQQFEAAKQVYVLAVEGPRAEDIAAQRAAYQVRRRRPHWRSGSSTTPASTPRPTAWWRIASSSPATWPLPRRRSSPWRCRTRSGSEPTLPRTNSAASASA